MHWDKLGASRSFVETPGNVSATVTLKAAPNGKSVILTCRLENQTCIDTHGSHKDMSKVTYEKEITALLVIDPYNDFIFEGGKVWDRLKGVAEELQTL